VGLMDRESAYRQKGFGYRITTFAYKHKLLNHGVPQNVLATSGFSFPFFNLLQPLLDLGLQANILRVEILVALE